MFSLSSFSIGLDISDHTIEVVALSKKGKRILLASSNRVALAPGIVENGRIKDEEALTQVLDQVFSTATPQPISHKEIIFGFPESQVYVQGFSVPEVDGKNMDEFLPGIIEKALPIPTDDVWYTYSEVGKSEKETRVVVAATSKIVVEEWQNFFQKRGYKIEGFDIETFAVARDLFPTPLPKPVCVLDIGASTTLMSIFDTHGLLTSQTIHIAGDAFTEALANLSKNIDMVAAEMQKKEISLLDASGSSLQPIVTELFGEVFRRIQSFENRTGLEVSDVVLVGGSSQMKGIVDVAAQALSKPVQLGQSALLGSDTIALEYIEAIGLAYRSIDTKWNDRDPAIQLFDKKKRKSISKKTAKQHQKHSGMLPIATEKRTPSKNGDHKKVQKQLFLLLSIIIIGGVLLTWALVSRNEDRKTAAEQKRIAAEQRLLVLPEVKEEVVEEVEVIAEDIVVTSTTSTTIISTSTLESDVSTSTLPVTTSTDVDTL